jgi:hypothetical protein
MQRYFISLGAGCNHPLPGMFLDLLFTMIIFSPHSKDLKPIPLLLLLHFYISFLFIPFLYLIYPFLLADGHTLAWLFPTGFFMPKSTLLCLLLSSTCSFAVLRGYGYKTCLKAYVVRLRGYVGFGISQASTFAIAKFSPTRQSHPEI